MAWLEKYKRLGTSNSLTVAQNIIIDGIDTLIPKNLPTFIIGSKNSGKSTFISTLINACACNEVYARVFYVSGDHVDSTMAASCKVNIIRVPLQQSIELLTQFFKIKTEYMSWVNYLTIESYTDNVIDTFCRNHKQDNPKQHAEKFLLRYSQPFTIKVDTTEYQISGLRYNQYDQLIIDDVGTAKAYLFPSSVNKSPIYRFLTISRHLLLGTIIAGQDIKQLELYARKEMNTWMFGIGISITEIANTQIPKNKQNEIIEKYPDLEKYHFILYNGINGEVQVV